jgi:PKD repeat protein
MHAKAVPFLIVLAGVTLLLPGVGAHAETLTVTPAHDNTLYDVADGSLSNGAGDYLHTGVSGQGVARRAVLAFDLSEIPEGSTVTAVQLSMNMSRSSDSVTRATALHRLLEDWGEAGSDAARGEGGGANAEPGDATWLHRFFADQLWTTVGGTFVEQASATQQVNDERTYVWGSTAQLVADVQGWVDDPSSNFGWIVIGAEAAGSGTAKRFDSRDNPTAANRPELTVTYTAAAAPVAGFEWSPAEPMAGQEVQFSDLSTGEPTSWMWELGDGATSMEQSPTHTYSSADTYTVSLTVENASGSDTATQMVTVTSDGPNLTELTFVAAAANAGGAGDSFWVTDVEVNNAGSTPLSYQFLWLPRDGDNSMPATSDVLYTLEPGASTRHANVLSSVFSANEVVGAVAILSDSDAIRVMSRTFNVSDSGTFGQSIPGMPQAELVPAGERVRVLFMTENGDFRSNLGLLNGIGESITVQWELFAPDGSSLATGSRELAGWSNTQLNRVFEQFAPIEGGYVDVWTETGGGLFTCYGSVVDEGTSDPTTVLPQ